MSDLVDKAGKTVQRISSELRPGLLDDLGLTAAIKWQLVEFQKRTGMRCELSLNPEDIILDQDISTALYRILQEALTNILKYACATSVKVRLKESTKAIGLEVIDNGRGITDEQILSHQSFGLIGMWERVHLLQGEIRIFGMKGKGTAIIIKIPLRRENGKDDQNLYC